MERNDNHEQKNHCHIIICASCKENKVRKHKDRTDSEKNCPVNAHYCLDCIELAVVPHIYDKRSCVRQEDDPRNCSETVNVMLWCSACTALKKFMDKKMATEHYKAEKKKVTKLSQTYLY